MLSPGEEPEIADALILPVWRRGTKQTDLFDDLDLQSHGMLGRMLESGEYGGRTGDCVTLPAPDGMAARRVVLAGAGRADGASRDGLTRAFAAAARHCAARRFGSVLMDGRGLHGPDQISLALCGIEMGRFTPRLYRTSAHGPSPIANIQLLNAGEEAVRRGQIIGSAVNIARRLTHEPANILDAPELSRRSEILAADAGLNFFSLGREEIEKLGMGAFAAVARGSATPPRLIVMEHEGAQDGPLLGLVGKGVTFDTGGISIKPALDMGRMKGDMAGGAAVIAAMYAIGKLNLPIRVLGVVPAVDNMPDGDALHPGDVITAMNGKTIEIISTDAEGRLLLADALHYARSRGCTHLIDLATLTGACGVALGQHASGLFAVDASWQDQVRQAGEDAGEIHWPMPLLAEYLNQIKSDIADLKNSGGRMAGAVTAAVFLKQFAGSGPWAHLDIAATSYLEQGTDWAPPGPSGFGVRTLINLAGSFAAQPN